MQQSSREPVLSPPSFNTMKEHYNLRPGHAKQGDQPEQREMPNKEHVDRPARPGGPNHQTGFRTTVSAAGEQVRCPKQPDIGTFGNPLPSQAPAGLNTTDILESREQTHDLFCQTVT
jgi:hypothetical protein